MKHFESLTLHGYWRSSCSWRVRIALAHKGLAYKNVAVNLAPSVSAQWTPEFAAKNPMNQVPVLEFHGGSLDGKRLTQSLAIIELMEHLVARAPLLPSDAWQRAKARQLAEIVNAGTQPNQNLNLLTKLKSLGGDSDAWAREAIGRGLAALERESKETAGKYLVGDSVTIADVCLVPQIYNARRFEVPLDGYPTLTKIEASLVRLEAFAVSHPDKQADAPKSL